MPLSLDRLDLLLRVATQAENEARRALGGARQKLAEQSRMQQELQGYLDEYQQPSTATPSAALLENRRLFVQRLSSAVQSQASQVEISVSLVQQAESRWLDSRRALRIAEQMHETGRRESQRVEESRQQRQQDDDTLLRRAASERRAW
jgi:flagellar export protein FliJ